MIIHVWALEVTALEARWLLPTNLGLAEGVEAAWYPIATAVAGVGLPAYREACVAALQDVWLLPPVPTLAELIGECYDRCCERALAYCLAEHVGHILVNVDDVIRRHDDERH